MAAGAVAETVATELEQVASDIENVASATRRIDGRVFGSLLVGVGIGAAVGFYIGYRYNKKKLRAEIFAEAEKEIAEVRDFYQRKVISVEAQDKPAVEDLVREKGYVSEEEPPHIEYSRLDDPGAEPDIRSIRPPVPVEPARPIVTGNFTKTESVPKDVNDDWDWEVEIPKRDPDLPFILHQDEYSTNESGYSQAQLIYYARDDILIDADDPQTILSNRETLIGREALNRFGHGSDDYNTVYVRNSDLEIEYEIHRVPKSWEEEIHGLENETG